MPRASWLTGLVFLMGLFLSGATTYAAMSSRLAVLEAQVESMDMKEIHRSLAAISYDIKAVKLVVSLANPVEAKAILGE